MLEQFQEELAREGKSQNTIDTYCRNVHLFLDWLADTTGETFSNKISVFDCREYKAHLINVRKQTPNTINAKLEAVQQYANFLYRHGFQEPITIQRQKVVPNYSVKIICKSDLYRCRRYANNYCSPRDAAIFEVLLNTGLRESELCALTMDDVQISDRKGKVIVRNGKYSKYREVPLNLDARNALQRYLSVRPAVKEGHMFLGQRGPLTRSAVYGIVHYICEQGAGISVSPHMIRHTTFTRMAKSGVDLATIADLAGHSDVKLTAKYYIATQDEDREKAVNSLDF